MRRPRLPDVSLLWTYQFRIDFRAIERWAIGHPEAVIIGLGAALRIATYLWNRPMWLDEGMLRGNVVDVPVLEFSGPLKSHQMAPIGFLIAERALAAVVGTRNYVLRFIPLAAGLAALVLFGRLARELLPRRPALVALLLFAYSDDMVYYSSEFKPYSLEVALGIAISLGAAGAVGRTPSTRAVIWLTVCVAAAPWFSFASAFVIAGCGLVLVLDALRSMRLTTALVWGLAAIVWLANLAISLEASRTQLAQGSPMWRFWDFAFMPLAWPATREGLLKSAGLLLEVFVNPLNLLAPGGSQFGVVLPLILLIAGGMSWARRSATTFLLLVSPIALAVIASISRRYPFHGRLILELVPALFLLIAAGTESIIRWFPTRSRIVYKTVLLALLTFPCWDACANNLTRRNRDFNVHGDLHDNVFIDRPVKKLTPYRATGG